MIVWHCLYVYMSALQSPVIFLLQLKSILLGGVSTLDIVDPSTVLKEWTCKRVESYLNMHVLFYGITSNIYNITSHISQPICMDILQ